MMYKVTMRCGHVGDGKYIPITYVVIAESKKEAIEKAKEVITSGAAKKQLEKFIEETNM